jgi:hypothetical protein
VVEAGVSAMARAVMSAADMVVAVLYQAVVVVAICRRELLQELWSDDDEPPKLSVLSCRQAGSAQHAQYFCCAGDDQTSSQHPWSSPRS